jgi:hypothetical protein
MSPTGGSGYFNAGDTASPLSSNRVVRLCYGMRRTDRRPVEDNFWFLPTPVLVLDHDAGVVGIFKKLFRLKKGRESRLEQTESVLFLVQ